jgi:methionyl-tRNA synthetase
MKPFYLTTPIYYVNDKPHIGHAYTTVAGDVATRWQRLLGNDVRFLTGTDEHGQKVMNTAHANQVSPQQWCDNLVENAWIPLWQDLNIANDDFIRTTQERHTARVGQFMQSLKEKGFIYQDKYEGPYCIGCEEFKLPADLDGDNCKIHSRPVETVSEVNWFFKLSAFVEPLIKLYENEPERCQPESARNEILSFLKSGVTDLSISRSTFDWGIPVPWDQAQVIYVWFDALLNYATALDLDMSKENGGDLFAKYFPHVTHLVGKDILRFHAVIWPAMLMAAGFPTPARVFAHGWLLVGGEKMSKSKLTGIAPADITSHFGVDAFRYYFLRAISFGSDGSFSWEHMEAVYESELANNLGNLASRVVSMIDRYCAGLTPAITAAGELSVALHQSTQIALAGMEKLDFQSAINAILDFSKAVNLYITQQEPWVLAKDENQKDKLEEVLYNCAESLRALATLLYPFMPETCEKLWKSLGADKAIGELAKADLPNVANWGVLPAGSKVVKGEILFPRLEPAGN